ncbi:Uncharacterised protein [Mycobacteroides abscessus subsp. abscessus]|nr:Uncharacterised protein [Mycobacteroides abscessus subsp. abscessus]
MPAKLMNFSTASWNKSSSWGEGGTEVRSCTKVVCTRGSVRKNTT